MVTYNKVVDKFIIFQVSSYNINAQTVSYLSDGSRFNLLSIYCGAGVAQWSYR